MKKIKLFLIGISLSTQVQAQLHGIDLDWYQTLEIMPKFNSTWNAKGAVANSMVVDKNGRVLIFYTEENGGTPNHYYTGSNDNGVTWTQPVPTQFSPSTTTTFNSSLSADIDTSDIIHVVWSSQNSKAVFYSNASASALTTWSDTLRIGTTTKNKIGFCQISTDRKMRLHTYWNEGDPGSIDTAEVFYSQSLNGGATWSTQIMLSEGDARHSAFPSGDFYGARGDTLAIAWRDSIGPGAGGPQDWDVKMVVSTDGGLSWSQPDTVAGGTGMQSDPAIVIDKNNTIHICYHEYPQPGGLLNAEVFYGYSTDLGATWNPPGFTKISEDSIQSHLVKEAYDYENDVVWYFYKDQRDYVSPFDKRADIMAVNITNNGTIISMQEFISDADSNEVGLHNFKVGRDGIPRSHFFIMPYGTSSPTLYYTQRTQLTGINDNALENINKISIYPNPFSSSTTLYVDMLFKDATLTIYNSFGQAVKQIKNISGQTVVLHRDNLPNGLYFIRLTQDNKINSIAKLVITD